MFDSWSLSWFALGCSEAVFFNVPEVATGPSLFGESSGSVVLSRAF